jgi:NAD(P)-dependent dehydrogenase (short-subunit alcohol dehydrogenase family)
MEANHDGQPDTAVLIELITGASGLLGVAMTERFLDAGWEVVATSRRRADSSPARRLSLTRCGISITSTSLKDERKHSLR